MFYIARMGIFDLFGSYDFKLDPVTFVYVLDPYSMEIHRMCNKITSYVKAFESYRLTDRQTDTAEIIYHALFVGGQKCHTHTIHFVGKLAARPK